MWYQASSCSVAIVIHEKAVDQVLMKLILRSFYVQTTGTLKLFGFQSLPPVHVINKEVCFSSLFLTDSSINVCHAAREAKVAVDVRGESCLYTLLTNSPHSVACQSRATDESLCLHFQRSFTGWSSILATDGSTSGKVGVACSALMLILGSNFRPINCVYLLFV